MDKGTKIETIKDYLNCKSDIEWCKRNIDKAKKNPFLPARYSQTIKKMLYHGIKIRNTNTSNETFKRFNYPLKYIQNVMNPGINQWNKWIILCALEYFVNEFEDIEYLQIIREYSKKKQLRKKLKSIVEKMLNNTY